MQTKLSSVLLDYRRTHKQQLEKYEHSDPLIIVDTNMLRELQTDMLELQSVFCLWLSQKQLHCPSCFKEVKQTQKQVQNIVNGMLREKPSDDRCDNIQVISRSESRVKNIRP